MESGKFSDCSPRYSDLLSFNLRDTLQSLTRFVLRFSFYGKRRVGTVFETTHLLALVLTVLSTSSALCSSLLWCGSFGHSGGTLKGKEGSGKELTHLNLNIYA